VNDILYRALARQLYRSREKPASTNRSWARRTSDKVIRIDQSPIGRTPRSNPATYTGVFTAIRDIYAMLPEARERGYKPGRFPSTSPAAAARPARAKGQRRIEMNFLPDVYVLCEVCGGRRYNHETLAVKYNGNSSRRFAGDAGLPTRCPFSKHSADKTKLQTLVDVGLGYIHLGQSAVTLSGGEAQRIKLARELSKRQNRQNSLPSR